jgi:hypothetical protein
MISKYPLKFKWKSDGHGKKIVFVFILYFQNTLGKELNTAKNEQKKITCIYSAEGC